jgi:beta-N-acetylhexosaminidase
MTVGRLTRRQLLVRVGTAGLGLVVAACSRAVQSLQPVGSPPAGPSASPSSTSEPTTAASTPAPRPGPDLRTKIAQMLLVGFRGLRPDPDSEVVRDIIDHRLGGVLLFSFDQPTGSQIRNIESPDQLKALVAGLQAAAAGTSVGVPLLVATDEEGGRVARLGPDHGFPATESEAALGARNDPAYTRAQAEAMAQTLAEAGVNLNLAPVVDLDLNPENPAIGALDRSFSADPEVVTSQALAFIAGHHEVGVRTTLKHFPGQGSATGDTHEGVVDVTEVWSEIELEPFERVIAAGSADAVLTAHVFNANLDPRFPATLSKATIGGILRDRIGYDGIVISDDMQMGAITDAFGYAHALALAIDAGVDILTIANQQVFEEGIVARTVDIIAGHVAGGRITEERIDASWERIRALKARLSGG